MEQQQQSQEYSEMTEKFKNIGKKYFKKKPS